jgi:hypothetical protein
MFDKVKTYIPDVVGVAGTAATLVAATHYGSVAATAVSFGMKYGAVRIIAGSVAGLGVGIPIMVGGMLATHAIEEYLRRRSQEPFPAT